ncbi:MAG: Rrf2 family transcriptional regulator [Eubacteriales bacterium]|jgi:Rrf2 family protein|nr:Rrf2 family transcriptional regulator [Eubacteriales bacterium]
MRISAKGRYALASVIHMAQHHHGGESITLIKISERLGISKIYLEQVFSLLKRGELVTSVKGAQGGYLLSRAPQQVSVLDVLTAVETSLFDRTEDTVAQRAPEIEFAMRKCAFQALDDAVSSALMQVTLEDLVLASEKHKGDDAAMYYI